MLTVRPDSRNCGGKDKPCSIESSCIGDCGEIVCLWAVWCVAEEPNEKWLLKPMKLSHEHYEIIYFNFLLALASSTSLHGSDDIILFSNSFRSKF